MPLRALLAKLTSVSLFILCPDTRAAPAAGGFQLDGNEFSNLIRAPLRRDEGRGEGLAAPDTCVRAGLAVRQVRVRYLSAAGSV